jgi:uncharacterized protein YceK
MNFKIVVILVVLISLSGCSSLPAEHTASKSTEKRTSSEAVPQSKKSSTERDDASSSQYPKDDKLGKEVVLFIGNIFQVIAPVEK